MVQGMGNGKCLSTRLSRQMRHIRSLCKLTANKGDYDTASPECSILRNSIGAHGCFSGFDENLDVQGELILQDAFQVWDPKSLIRKGRERHLFLFEISLVFSKEIKDSSGHTKYVYKNKLLVGGAGGTRQDSPASIEPMGRKGYGHVQLTSSLLLYSKPFQDKGSGLLLGKLPSTASTSFS